MLRQLSLIPMVKVAGRAGDEDSLVEMAAARGGRWLVFYLLC